MILDEVFYIYEAPSIESPNVLPGKIESLPASLQKNIRFDDSVPPPYYVIRVNSSQLGTIAALDSLLYSLPNPTCRKRRDVGASDSEVDNLPYYFANFRTIEMGKDFDAEITKPSCHYKSCSSGTLSLPITLKSRHCFKCDMVELKLSNVPDAYFLVSDRFKVLFDTHGVTGIEYFECNLSKGLNTKFSDGRSPWLARVTGSCYQFAERIEIKRWACPEHEYYMLLKYYNGLRLYTSDIPELDCITIRGIKTLNGVINARPFETFFTQKVMSLLIKNKARKLGVMEIPFKSHLYPMLPFDYPVMGN